MKYLMGILGFLSSFTGVSAQTPAAFALYDTKGKSISYEKMVKELAQADVVLFGEFHDNPICHWLELRLAKDLHALKKGDFVMGAEMFEADNQMILDEYLAGNIKENHLTEEAKVWNNYKTDYRPLVEYAKAHSIPFVATNIPRRYASMVARMGLASLDKLSAAAKAFMCPLPLEVDLELSQYKKMTSEMSSSHGGGENMVRAQAIKDATMAHFILQNQKGKFFYHINGAYHSDYFEGIVWYLRRAQPKLKIATLTSRKVADPTKYDESAGEIATFIIQIAEDITKTY